jgi:hypothetical protein
LEFSPVDDTARAVITLAQHYDKVRSMFHVYHDTPVQFIDYVKALRESGIKIKAVTMKEFLREVRSTANLPGKSHIYESFMHNIGEDGSLHAHSNIRLCNRSTIQCLGTLGFKWQKIDASYLKRYVAHFRDIGYWGAVNP